MKSPPIAEQKTRCLLVNDVSREQIECSVQVAEAFGVDKPVLSLSGRPLWLVKESPKVLTCCLAIPRLVSSADDNIYAGPPPFAKVIAPSRDKRVHLFEFQAHGELRSFESVFGEGANVFLESLQVDDTFGEDSVNERTRPAQQLLGRFHFQ